MISVAIQDCRKWLGDSLQALRLRAHPISHAAVDASLEARSTEILKAFCDGDLQRAEAILSSSGSTPGDPIQLSFSMILPVIHQLETEWQTGQRSYVDTLFAFWNIERLMSHLASQRPRQVGHNGSAWGRVLLAAAPNTHHVFGLAIVEESFRAAGWDTQTFTNEHPDGILHAARSSSVDFIGLSVGHDEAFCELARFISLLRQESRNHEVKIMLGGNVFSSPASQYDWLDADLVALSVEDALAFCSGMASMEFSRN